MRVHWAAGCVPNEATDMCLVQYGTVVTSANEQSTVAGFEGVATGIRSVFMSGNRGQIPHILQVADPVTAEVYKLLCVITGRKPQYIAAFNHSPIVENIWLRIVTGTWKLKTRRRFHSAAQDNSRIAAILVATKTT